MMLSVIIPCYNSSKTLERAIQSLLQQTLLPDEIIVIDDCSNDNVAVAEIASEYLTVRLIRNTENLGLAGSRNVGLWASKCDVVAFLDADDESHCLRLELQMQCVAENQVVACDSARELQELSLSSYRTQLYSRPYFNMLFNRLTGASLMGSAALLKKHGGYDSDMRAGEDYDLWIRLLDAGVGVARVKLPLYLYHDTEDSLSKNDQYTVQSIIYSVKKFVASTRGVKQVFAKLMLFFVLSKQVIRAEVRGSYSVVSPVVKSSITDFFLIRTGVEILAKLKIYTMCAFFIRRLKK
jgi:glycosyltransferase involved in cell wall biosynthesis